MNVGYIQFAPVFGEPGTNTETILGLIESAQADLLVLPELATTGYNFTTPGDLARIAEPFTDSPSLDAIHDLAMERSCAVVAGFAELAGDRLYNSSALLRPDGSRELYRKAHLFGAENTLFSPGDIPFTAHDLDGVKVGMMICFDWFFPETMRLLALRGAQIVCHPVNFVLPWGQRAMAIRSLENRVFAITANRYGTEANADRTFTFTGASQVTTPKADVLVQAPVEGDHVAVVDIDPEEAASKRINSWNDLFVNRRTDLYDGLV